MLRPREVIVAQGVEAVALLPEIARLGIAVTPLDEWAFGVDRATKTLCDQLRTSGLHAFGLDGHPAATCAAGALVEYLRDTQKVDLAHVRAIGWRERQDGLLIDPMTFRHLEILEGADGGRDGSLLSVLDRTQTVMGARRLRAWLMRPLTALERIQDRLDAVEEFAFKATERGRLRDTLRAVHDLERLVGRVAIGTAGPRDLVALRQSLAAIPRVRLVLEPMAAPLVGSLVGELDDLADVRDALAVGAGRGAAGAGPRRRHDPRRRRPRPRRAARHQPLRPRAHRGDGGGRAGADRHQLAEDPLQPRLRLLHRDLEDEPRARSRRLPPQADDRRRRALHHARR